MDGFPYVLAPQDHEERMKHAKARAQWELGDSSWAFVILHAYLCPEADAQNLAREKVELS